MSIRIIGKIAEFTVYFGLVVLFTLISFHYIPKFFIAAGRNLNFSDKSGPIGDTIGGTLGPFVGIIAAVLTYMAFRIQYDANIQQRKDIAQERFENKFFEMLRLHKENLNELSLPGFRTTSTITKRFDPSIGAVTEDSDSVIPIEIRGREVFGAFYEELVGCYSICKEAIHFEVFETAEKRREYLIKASYRICFSGINSLNTSPIDENIEKDKDYTIKFKLHTERAKVQQAQYSREYFNYKFPGGNIDIKLPGRFKLFSGHVDRLGHYYRHLFLLVKFVTEQDPQFITYIDKRQYLRMLRAQLSRHEQLMLYFNYISGYGDVWENDQNKFFSDYRMIHNLPIELTKFCSDPYQIFQMQIKRVAESGEQMFEYDE